MYEALHSQCFPSVCENNSTGKSGGNRTHDLLFTFADVLTSWPSSLPDDNRPARIRITPAGSVIFIDWWNSSVGWLTIGLILRIHQRMYEALHAQYLPSVCENNSTGDSSGGIRTHDHCFSLVSSNWNLHVLITWGSVPDIYIELLELAQRWLRLIRFHVNCPPHNVLRALQLVAVEN